MGQGGGGDKPNRGGDRDGARRKADDEAAAEAERVVQNALDEARDARQHSPESRSARIIRDRALSEPPGRMVMPVKRGTTDPKRVTAGQIEYDINNLEFVENSGVRGAYYYGLRDEEFKTAVSQIEAVCDTENNSTATNNVVKRMRGWKHGSGDRSAQTHESTFKQALDIEAPIRDVADGPAERDVHLREEGHGGRPLLAGDPDERLGPPDAHPPDDVRLLRSEKRGEERRHTHRDAAPAGDGGEGRRALHRLADVAELGRRPVVVRDGGLGAAERRAVAGHGQICDL